MTIPFKILQANNHSIIAFTNFRFMVKMVEVLKCFLMILDQIKQAVQRDRLRYCRQCLIIIVYEQLDNKRNNKLNRLYDLDNK